MKAEIQEELRCTEALPCGQVLGFYHIIGVKLWNRLLGVGTGEEKWGSVDWNEACCGAVYGSESWGVFTDEIKRTLAVPPYGPDPLCLAIAM